MAFLLAMSSVAMANSAYPGHVLYGFDRALERIGIGDGGRPERLAEIEKLAANGDFDSMEGLVDEILTTARSVADGINPETLTARTEVIVPIGPKPGAGNSVGDGETSPQPIPSNENPGFGPGEIGNGGSADPAPGHPSVAGNVTQQTPSEGASQAGPPANEGSQNGSAGPDAPPSGTGQAEPGESPEHSNAGGNTDTTPGPPEHSNAGGNTDTTPGPPDHSNAGGNTNTPPGPPAD